jgi:hypothetical protein
MRRAPKEEREQNGEDAHLIPIFGMQPLLSLS